MIGLSGLTRRFAAGGRSQGGIDRQVEHRIIGRVGTIEVSGTGRVPALQQAVLGSEIGSPWAAEIGGLRSDTTGILVPPDDGVVKHTAAGCGLVAEDTATGSAGTISADRGIGPQHGQVNRVGIVYVIAPTIIAGEISAHLHIDQRRNSPEAPQATAIDGLIAGNHGVHGCRLKEARLMNVRHRPPRSLASFPAPYLRELGSMNSPGFAKWCTPESCAGPNSD